MATFSINVRPRITLSIASRSRETFVTGEVKEYSEVRVTPLKSTANYGSVPAADYSWFKGVYSSLVDGSVISWIKGLVNQVKLLATRVGTIEDYSWLKRFEVPVDHLVSGEYFNSAIVSGSANYTTALSNNKLIMFPFTVSKDITVDSAMLRVYSGVSLSKIRIGIYEGNSFYPYSRIWSSNEIETETAGIKNEALSLALYKNKVYWFAYIVNSVDPRIYLYQPYQNASIKGTSLPASYNSVYISMAYGPMPLTLEGLSMVDYYSVIPIISLKKS